MPPTPGGSVVPRANTTSTSGHGSADADGTDAIGDAQMGAAAAQMRAGRERNFTPGILSQGDIGRPAAVAGDETPRGSALDAVRTPAAARCPSSAPQKAPPRGAPEGGSEIWIPATR